jgi:hypothetical protein
MMICRRLLPLELARSHQAHGEAVSIVFFESAQIEPEKPSSDVQAIERSESRVRSLPDFGPGCPW